MGSYEDFIGRSAGLVWGVLNESKEPCSINHLMEATDLSNNEVAFALGWLAREGKVVFSDEGKGKLSIRLISVEYYF